MGSYARASGHMRDKADFKVSKAAALVELGKPLSPPTVIQANDLVNTPDNFVSSNPHYVGKSQLVLVEEAGR
jgi:hypothetical protein